MMTDHAALDGLPIVPPMVPVGCERDWLAHNVYERGGAIVTAVGAGLAAHDPGMGDGIKRFAAVELRRQALYPSVGGSYTKLVLERFGEETGIRDGDSGGPILEVVPDGTWRVIGVINGTGTKEAWAEAVPPYLH